MSSNFYAKGHFLILQCKWPYLLLFLFFFYFLFFWYSRKVEEASLPPPEQLLSSRHRTLRATSVGSAPEPQVSGSAGWTEPPGLS